MKVKTFLIFHNGMLQSWSLLLDRYGTFEVFDNCKKKKELFVEEEQVIALIKSWSLIKFGYWNNIKNAVK